MSAIGLYKGWLLGVVRCEGRWV